MEDAMSLDDDEPIIPMPYDRESTDDWVAQDAIDALAMDKHAWPERTPMEHAEQILVEAVPAAATAIVHMAIHSPNERIRLDAAKYIVERAPEFETRHRKYTRTSAQSSQDPLDIVIGKIFDSVTEHHDQESFDSTYRPNLPNRLPNQKG